MISQPIPFMKTLYSFLRFIRCYDLAAWPLAIDSHKKKKERIDRKQTVCVKNSLALHLCTLSIQSYICYVTKFTVLE